MSRDYAELHIKSYDLWDLFLHENQYPYIGRCYAWAKRPEAESFQDIDAKEMTELHRFVFPDWNYAANALFRPDLDNVAFLCNTANHLHGHFIPRYHSPRTYKEIEFIDPNPTGNYAPYRKITLPDKILLSIRDDFKRLLR